MKRKDFWRLTLLVTLAALCMGFASSLGSLLTPQDPQAQTDYPDLLVRSGDAILRYNWLTMAPSSFVPAGSGGLAIAFGMAFGPDANLYVCNYNTNEILHYDRQTGAFLGAFVTSGSGGLEHPRALTFGPDGNLYVSSGKYIWIGGIFTPVFSILMYDGQTGAFLSVFVPPGSEELSYTDSLLFGPDGNLYAFTTNPLRILRYDGQTGAFLDVFINSFPSGSPSQPFSMAFGLDGNLLILVEQLELIELEYEGAVLRYDGQTGAFLDIFVPFGSGGLHYPSNLTIGPTDGNIYVSSYQETLAESPHQGAVRRYDRQTGDFLSLVVPPGSSDLEDAGAIVFMPVGVFGLVQLDGRPLAGVTVELKLPGRDGKQETTTDLNGCYSFRSVGTSKGTITIDLPER